MFAFWQIGEEMLELFISTTQTVKMTKFWMVAITWQCCAQTQFVINSLKFLARNDLTIYTLHTCKTRLYILRIGCNKSNLWSVAQGPFSLLACTTKAFSTITHTPNLHTHTHTHTHRHEHTRSLTGTHQQIYDSRKNTRVISSNDLKIRKWLMTCAIETKKNMASLE